MAIKSFFVIVLLLISFRVSAQDKPSKEEFLNAIAGQLLDYNPKFIYLYNKTLKIDADSYFKLEKNDRPIKFIHGADGENKI